MCARKREGKGQRERKKGNPKQAPCACQHRAQRRAQSFKPIVSLLILSLGHMSIVISGVLNCPTIMVLIISFFMFMVN